MKLRKIVSSITLFTALICTLFSIGNVYEASKSSASVVKNTEANAQNGLNPITYNGQEMYVANATFYDYYSDSQIGTSSAPLTISDALDGSKNTFSKLNNKLLTLKKYGNASECPAKYPMYQGRPGALSDMAGICYPNTEDTTSKANYWVAANIGQINGVATQGLVDTKLTYTSDGEGHLTQSNPANGKSTYVPFFDKKFLTENKYDNSALTLGSVKENVSFPFRRVDKNGTIYYEFYSSHDTIRFNSNNQLDYLGYDNKNEQVLDAQGQPGFFPYNTKAEGKSAKLNFGHGVKIELPFNMTKNGKINNKDMIFEFSGDDDVWVFIDGELALDMGGNHGEVYGSINFASSTATVNKVKNNKVAFAKRTLTSFNFNMNTIAELGITNEQGIFTDYKTPFPSTLVNKLKDTTKTHTLTLFYMERGLNVANMKMSFNLPEPTRLNVTNTVQTDNVGNVFKAETDKVASKDEFLYDVEDKTLRKTNETSLKSKESVSFINEYDTNDSILLQEKGLKNTSRKLTDLYSTDWLLKDITTTIAKDKTLFVKDNRSGINGTFLFANISNNDVAVLTANYTNMPKIGTFELACEVTDIFKNAHTDYANSQFEYTITYSNVFGGNSSEVKYNGPYTLHKVDGTTEELTTQNGIINLKPGEKATIDKIPVETKLNVSVAKGENYGIKTITCTNNFKPVSTTNTITGKINSTSNKSIFTITDKTDASEKTDEVIKPIPVEPNKEDSKLSKLQETTSPDALDASPKTSDSTNINTWLSCLAVSSIISILSLISLTKGNKKRYRL